MEDGVADEAVVERAAEGAILADPQTTDELIAGLEAILCENTQKGPEQAAKYIIDHRFGGSLDRYREHGKGSPSLSELAGHEKWRWGRAKLNSWLQVYDFCDRAGRRDWVLDFSHLVAVLGVRDLAAQVALLDEAVEKRWTTRELATQVRLRKPSRRVGRKREPLPVRTIKAVSRALAAHEAEAAAGEADAPEPLPSEQVRQLDRLEAFLREMRKLGRAS